MSAKAIQAEGGAYFSFASLRLRTARALVVVSFVWPFINASYFSSQASFEVNFLPVFLAAALVPEALFEDWLSLVFVVATLTLVAIWGPPTSAYRIVIGVVPLLFLVSLHRLVQHRGEELIPRGIAYRALQVFVGFSVLQYVNFFIAPIIPGGLTNLLMILIPRYADTPYDQFGVRGVQGWASEPSGAIMTCFCFCVVAMHQEPKKCWRILFWFAILESVNKSIYGILYLALLALICVWRTKNKLVVPAMLLVAIGMFSFFTLHSARVSELSQSLALYSSSPSLNREFARFIQIAYPLLSFPRIYVPVTIFGVEMQPLGLLPLLAGFGSVIGCVLYYRLIFLKLRFADLTSVPMGIVMILTISLTAPPDFIPVIVAFSYAISQGKDFVRANQARRRLPLLLYGNA